jgi:hypothetical protein
VEVVGLGEGRELAVAVLDRGVEHLLKELWFHVVVVAITLVEVTPEAEVRRCHMLVVAKNLTEWH